MNMNGLNLLAMLSGAVRGDDSGRLLQGDGQSEGEFAAILMEQIASITQAGLQENGAMPLADWASSNPGQIRSVQDLAALLGKQLPVAENFEREIDLEETLGALQEVLAHIEAATEFSTSPGSMHDIVDRSEARQAFAGSAASQQNADETLVPGQAVEQAVYQRIETIIADIEDNVPTALFPVASQQNADETLVPGQLVERAVHQDAETIIADIEDNVPTAIFPVVSQQNADEILVVGQLVEQAVYQDAETIITDNEDNVPKLVKNLLQNGEELSHGKSLIEKPRIGAENKAPSDGKAFGWPAETESKIASTEKKMPAEMVDKPVPKMGLEIAQLHRQIAGQTKVEVPAMNKPMDHPQWDQELGERIVWMNNRTIPFAELRLNPQHLGPISIRIDMNQEQATIAFSAQQASVREAIEAAIPKLREMLGAQQLNLAEVNVTQPSATEQSKFAGFGQAAQQHNEGGQKNGRGAGSFDQANNPLDSSEETDGGRAFVSSGILNLFA